MQYIEMDRPIKPFIERKPLSTYNERELGILASISVNLLHNLGNIPEGVGQYIEIDRPIKPFVEGKPVYLQ